MKRYSPGEITMEDFSAKNTESRDPVEAIKIRLAAAKAPKKQINFAGSV